MSAEKYAQFIAEQQKKLSVSGTNPVNLIEKKELSDKQKDIAKLAGDKDEIDDDDLKKLRSKKKDDDDDDKDDDNAKPKTVKEEEQLDELKMDKKTYVSAMQRTTGYDAGDEEGRVDSDKLVARAKKYKGDKFAKDLEGAHGMAERPNRNKVSGQTGNDKLAWRSPAKSTASGKANKTALKALKASLTKGDYRKPNLTKKNLPEEASYISEEESQYIEEMVSKGKLPEIADFHKKAADHAYKMRVHHQMMADKSEDVGDSEGFDHHIEQAMRHDYDHEHHMARFDHAASLKARNQAHKDLKAAKDKAAKARDAKRDWA